MKWFIYALENTFCLSGRARRAEFCWFSLISGLIHITLLTILMVVYTWKEFAVAFYIVILIYSCLITIPTFSLTVRRMHDLGWSGWWLFGFILSPLLILFIQQGGIRAANTFLITLGIIYVIGVLILYFKDGQRFTNKYGEDPKVVGSDAESNSAIGNNVKMVEKSQDK